MRSPYRTTFVAATVLAAVALTTPASAHSGRQLVVRSGQSIQVALDAARPGDTVLVRAGVYRENLQISTDGITLRGVGARLEPPATPTSRRCNEYFGIPENPYGICVAGERDSTTGQLTRPVRGVTIEGLTVGTYTRTGIIGYGTDGIVLRHNDIAGGAGDSGYSVLLLISTHADVVGNRVHGAGGAGIYIGSSPDSHSRIAYNVAFGSGSLGIMVRDSTFGVVQHNLVYDNCMGIGFVDGRSAGTAASWTATDNMVRRNNAVCPGEPAVSGVGVLLAGARDITVERNVIVGNAPAAATAPYGGGVVLTSGSVFGGTDLATDNLVTHNVVVGNAPADLNLHDAGPGNRLTGNVCRSSAPAGLC